MLSSFSLRSKKDLIDRFVESINNESDVEGQWKKFVEEAKSEELGKIIAEENLNPQETVAFINKALVDGELKSAGTAVTKLLPAKNMFSPSYEHSLQKTMVIEKLKAFFDRFSNL